MLAAAAGGTPQTMDCSIDAMVVTPTELDRTSRRGGRLQRLHLVRGGGARHGVPRRRTRRCSRWSAPGAIPPIPDLAPALAGQSVTFGPYFTLDGVHPSTLAHQLVADSLVSKVNSFFGTNIP